MPVGVGPAGPGRGTLCGNAAAKPRRQSGCALPAPGRTVGPGSRRRRPGPLAALRSRRFGGMGLHHGPVGLPSRGRLGHSRNLLLAASRANGYVPEYLVGNKSMPSAPPGYVSLGGEDEAVSYSAQFLRAWRSSPGAIPWLRKTLQVPLPQPPRPRKPAWPLFRHAFLRIPQVEEEVWQLDVCRMPLSYVDGKPFRPPWALVLWNRTEDAILALRPATSSPRWARCGTRWSRPCCVRAPARRTGRRRSRYGARPISRPGRKSSARSAFAAASTTSWTDWTTWWRIWCPPRAACSGSSKDPKSRLSPISTNWPLCRRAWAKRGRPTSAACPAGWNRAANCGVPGHRW